MLQQFASSRVPLRHLANEPPALASRAVFIALDIGPRGMRWHPAQSFIA
jgi:hypothetical protein